MADEAVDDALWQQENVPDADALYMRIHASWIQDDGEISPGVIKDQPSAHPGPNGMSTDWDKYSSAATTRSRAKEPAKNAVVKMSVLAVRAVPGQIVLHAPRPNEAPPNRAHTNVCGEKKKDPEVRVKFIRAMMWEIRL